MPGEFDPYRTWLGIPPEEQPPNHYRLLGIPPFEDQPEAIEHAADRQMAHLRTLQTGEHAALSQRLLNEVAAARICLLNPEKKAAYDAQLRRQLQPQPAPARKPPVVAHAAGAAKAGPAEQETADWTALGQLGEYKLLEKLGAGGMGEVYKAVHTEMDRVVAVKVLPPGHLQDERAVARFKREIKAVAQLDHPNIVRAHDAREVEGTRFLVMEYVEGMDLRDVAKRLGPLPIPEACELILQAALGLQCAHEHGLVHRDIKPGNLMLTERGVVKLLDLGLARAQIEQGGEEEVTGTGEAMGTADFMAPEQAADSRSVDIRADLYSLGCTLYRLIAGRAPFSGPQYNTAVKKLMGHIQDPVPPITKFRPDVPNRLEIILGRLLAKDPAQRLHTPAEVAEALAPLSAGSDLAGLYTRAMGRIPAPPPPQQAEVPTHSSQSSGLTQFFDRIKGAAPEPTAHAPAAAQPKKTPVWLGYAAMGAVALLIILAWGVWPANKPAEQPHGGHDKTVAEQHGRASLQPTPSEPKQTAGQLILRWPADQRGDAMLEIDDQRRDVSELTSPADPQTLRIELKPGRHKVWIARRGFEPFEQTVSLDAGKTAAVTPEWKKLPEVAVAPEPKPAEPKPAEKPKPKDVAVEKPKPPQPKIDPAIEAREQKWRTSVEPVEKLAGAWDFAGAEAELQQLRFDEAELSARVARRRDELERMAALKAKMIARIKASVPRLKKSDLMLRGINGDVTAADDQAIHARLASGKTEEHPWADLNDKARPELLKLAIEQTSPDDWLAAGLMAFSAGDVGLAEKLLDKARSLGTDIAPYLGLLAAGTYAEATKLLDEQKWSQAKTRLEELRQKYGTTPWFAESRPLVDTAIARAKTGIHQAEAEKLYAEAAKLFEARELFDLRDVIHKLKADYPAAVAVTDTHRKPPFAELEQAVADLGTRLIVRQDGKGDFKSIQEAVSAAPPNSVIEIHDNGPYRERILFNKAGLTIRGKTPAWPVVTSEGHPTAVGELVSVTSPRAVLQRLLLIHSRQADSAQIISVRRGAGCHARNVLGYLMNGQSMSGIHVDRGADPVQLDECVFVCRGALERTTIRNTILFARGNHLGHLTNCVLENSVFDGSFYNVSACTVRASVFWGYCGLKERPSVLTDSIVKELACEIDGCRLENCDVLQVSGTQQVRQSYLSMDPMFANPKMGDYRLLPPSPCRGKASDGGDIGCRYTPEMIEMCKIALELRRRGIIKF